MMRIMVVTLSSGMRSSGVGLLLPLEVVRKINKKKTALENITVH